MTGHYLAHLAELGTTDLHPLGRQATWRLIAALDLQPGQRVLEIGCGTGGTMVMAGGQTAVQITGIDPLTPMLQMAHKRLQLAGRHDQLTLSQANGVLLPFAAHTFDRVYMESVLGFQTAVNATAMLHQVFRVLKPGGRYIANEAIWKATVSAPQTAAIYTANMVDFGISQASEQAWGVAEWLRLMRQTGFELITADLLENATEMRKSHPPRALRISDWLSRLYRARRLVHPRLAWQSLGYRRRLARHRDDGQWIESRLFVLAKPESPTLVKKGEA